MKTRDRFKLFSVFLITACLLAACSGALPQSATSAKGSNGEANVAVGDKVKVEANISADGSVVAFKVESTASDASLSAVSPPSADVSSTSTPDPVGTPFAATSAVPDLSSTSDPSTGHAASSSQNEVFGTVEAITSDTITINGVKYNLSQGFTEIKGNLAVGDPVKLHVTVNADGSFTVRDIEKSAGTTVNDNSGNSNSSNDGQNHDINDHNSNSSSNGAGDGQNHDSHDDHGGSSGNSASEDD